jgi:type II secretory pathway pseudopilin PulG
MKTIGMRGVTLMELLVIILIMAVMAGFVSLSADMIRRERVASAARILYADLQKARLDAMTLDGAGFGIRIESPNSYVMFKFADCNGDYAYEPASCMSGISEEVQAENRTLDSSLQLRRTGSMSSDVRIFDRFGIPRAANWGMGNVTFIVESVPDAGLAKCVSVSTNRIREGVWNGSSCI